MSRLFTTLFALALCCALATGTALAAPENFPDGAKMFYVSPDGNDDAPGTRAAPLSLAGLQAQIKKADAKSGNVAVRFLDGIYYLAEPFVLSSRNSGWSFRALSSATLSGGRPLALKWTPFRDGIFQAAVPADVKLFDQLFVNGRLQVLARFPDFAPDAQFLNGTSAEATSPKRAARWKSPAGGFVHALHRSHWGDMHYRITGKTDDNTLLLEGGWQNNRPEYGPHKDHRFVEGIFEELDAPGEWFFNADTHTLYFYPPAGLDLGKATIVVPQLENLVHFAGTQENPVSNAAFSNFTFKHTLRTFMKKKEPLQRSDWCVYRGGAVLFENTGQCGVYDSTFTDLGGNAIFVNNRNTGVRIEGCYIHDIGANAIAFVGSPESARSPLFHYSKNQPFETMDKTPGPKGDNFPKDSIVRDCLITRIGRVEKQTTGVNIDLSQRITVSHCTIAEVPRAGLNIGSGTWGGHRIEDNDIFDTVRETGDHGSFNSWGRDRFWYPDRNVTTNRLVAKEPSLPFWDAVEPITINHNRWRCDRGWDIDLDDGSTNYRITNNLCLNGGIKLREGYGRIVENNITVNNGFHPHAWYEKSGDIVRQNIFFRPHAPSGSMRVPVWGKTVDSNLLHVPGAEGVRPAAALQKLSKQDAHSLTADAGFINAAAGDYRVADNSPALALGFVNFPMDSFGVTSGHLKKLAPVVKLPGANGADTATPLARRDGTVVVWQGAQVKNVVGLTDISAAGLPEEIGVIVVGDAGKSALLKRYGVQNDDVILKWGDVPVPDLAALRRAAEKIPAPAELQIWRQQHPLTLRLN
jgi:hypothetical protein